MSSTATRTSSCKVDAIRVAAQSRTSAGPSERAAPLCMKAPCAQPATSILLRTKPPCAQSATPPRVASRAGCPASQHRASARLADGGAHYRPKGTEFPRKPCLWADNAPAEAATPPASIASRPISLRPPAEMFLVKHLYVPIWRQTCLPSRPSASSSCSATDSRWRKNFEFGKTHAIQVRTGRRSVKATFSVQVLCGKLPFNVSAAHGVTSEFDIFSPCGTPLNARDERGDATRA